MSGYKNKDLSKMFCETRAGYFLKHNNGWGLYSLNDKTQNLFFLYNWKDIWFEDK